MSEYCRLLSDDKKNYTLCSQSRKKMKTIIERYPKYKDSGVDWLGVIPVGWKVFKLGTLLRPVSTKNRADLPLLSITRELGVIERDADNLEENHNYIQDDLSNYKVIQQGQFGMNKMKAWQGSYGISPYMGIVSPAYYVFDFSAIIHPSFFQQAIRSRLYVSFFGQASDGVRIGQWDLSKPRMKDIPFFFPPLPEQTAIASFLDEKTAKIDKAISQKEQMISLLKERKQILIQNAVTKGIDPSAKMKDSGVEWIGEIPEGWVVKRFKYLFRQSNLPTRKTDGVVTSYRDGQVTLRSNRRMEGYTEAILEHGYQGVRKGQLVLNSVDAFEGAVGVSESDGKCTPEYVVCDAFNDLISPDYFAFLLREMALAKYIQVVCSAVRQRAVRIRFSNLSRLFFIVPSLAEQANIVAYIKKNISKIDKVIIHQQQQISKLKEYKSTLIDSAVTGKIKVC